MYPFNSMKLRYIYQSSLKKTIKCIELISTKNLYLPASIIKIPEEKRRILKDRIVIYNSQLEQKVQQLEFLEENVQKQYPVIYKAVNYNDELNSDILLLQSQNVQEMHFQYLTRLNVMTLLENFRILPQSLQKVSFYINPYDMTIETADLLFKNFLFLPKGIAKIHINMTFYDNEDNISRFLIINLPRFNHRLQCLKINLSGFSNLLEFSKKFDTLPQNLKRFKLVANNIQLTPGQFATFASNLYRLPKTLTKINISLDEICSLEPLHQAFSKMPPLINNIRIKCKSAQYSNEEMIEFLQVLKKSFKHLSKLRLFLPNNLISQDSFNIICSQLPPNLTKFYCKVSGYNTNDSLKVFPLNVLQKVYLDLSENYNSDEDIIDFFERLYSNENITHLHLVLNDEETDFKCIQFIIDNLDKLPKQLTFFKLLLMKPKFSIDKLQIPDNMFSKIPENIKQFSIKINFKLTFFLVKQFIALYKQIEQLHLGLNKFNFKLNFTNIFFTIKGQQINITSILGDLFKDKQQIKKFNDNFIQLLFDTPPYYKFANLSIHPMPSFV